jgi:hypothetical protein
MQCHNPAHGAPAPVLAKAALCHNLAQEWADDICTANVTWTVDLKLLTL